MIALIMVFLGFCIIGILGLTIVINVINRFYDKNFLNKNLNKNGEKTKSNLYQ